MKFLLAIFICVISIFCTGCTSNQNNDILRIHIRANSNSDDDQNVKLKVRDEVIDFITPLIADCEDCADVKDCLNLNLNKIENVADEVLQKNGFGYSSKASINNEFFPSRDYDGKTFPADYYDALILELGTGDGDNWWCVAYPPLCFVGYECGSGIQYRSKLMEIINEYFGG